MQYFVSNAKVRCHGVTNLQSGTTVFFTVCNFLFVWYRTIRLYQLTLLVVITVIFFVSDTTSLVQKSFRVLFLVGWWNCEYPFLLSYRFISVLIYKFLRIGTMTFVYTGKGRRGAQPDDAPPEQKKCAKQACAIQWCLAKRGHQERLCRHVIEEWESCCEKARANAATSN